MKFNNKQTNKTNKGTLRTHNSFTHKLLNLNGGKIMNDSYFHLKTLRFLFERKWPWGLRLFAVFGPTVFRSAGIYDGGRFQRGRANKLFPTVAPEPSKVAQKHVKIKDFEIAGVAENSKISCRLFTSSVDVGDSKKPLVLWLHGGGWVLGNPFTAEQKHLGESFALAGAHYLTIDFRLAPENKFPAGLQDCYEVLRWMASEDSSSILPADVDYSKIVLGGDSAGGNLSLVLAQLMRDKLNADLEPEALQLSVAHILLLYPALNLDHVTESEKNPENSAFIPPKIMNFFVKSYAGDNLENALKDRRFSPLLGGVQELPPLSCIVGRKDLLYNHSTALVDELKRVDGLVYFHENEMPHGFLVQLNSVPSRAAVYDMLHDLSVSNVLPSSSTDEKIRNIARLPLTVT